MCEATGLEGRADADADSESHTWRQHKARGSIMSWGEKGRHCRRLKRRQRRRRENPIGGDAVQTLYQLLNRRDQRYSGFLQLFASENSLSCSASVAVALRKTGRFDPSDCRYETESRLILESIRVRRFPP